MTLNSNGDDKSILVSPISADPDVDVATIASELVQHVLGIHRFVTAAYEYRGDLPVVDTASGTMSQHRNSNRHNSNTKHQTNIDWDRFLDIWEGTHGKSRVALAEYLFTEYNSYLLHIVCLCGAPEDVVQALLDVSLLPLTKKCGMNMKATPLHLACFAGCSPHTVEKLLQADRQHMALFMKDAEGRIPLHVACEKGVTAGSAGIVKLLLDSDVKKESLNMVDRHGATPLQVAAQISSESVIAHLLEAVVQADEMKDNVFNLVDLPQQLPLHRAFHRRTASPGNIVHLLSTGASKANLTTKDRRGQLPIHVALKCGAGAEALKELINNDKTGETFTATDMSHETPADLLIRKVSDGDESVMRTLEQLAEADESRRFFGTENKQGQTMLDELLKSVQKLSSGSLTELQTNSVLLMISCTLPKSGNYSYSLKKSQKLLGVATYGRIFADPRFHKTLNIPMSKRSFTTFFMLDLYIRILLVTMFTIATERAIQGENNTHWVFALVYLTSGYLLTWQLMLMRTHQLYYLREVWNLLDLLTLILVVISVSMLHSGIEHTGSFRAFNTLVGGLVWLVLITGALRSTFLPFSVFISGFTLVRIISILSAYCGGKSSLTKTYSRLTACNYQNRFYYT
jgi:ankyrin repeat protein